MRLDRYDSYLTEFHGELLEVRRESDGTWLRLDRSAFYPTAGGQLHDRGTLTVDGAELAVEDVQDRDGAVWHRVEAPDVAALRAGAEVHGRIDRDRRYRHMQRHTAQHLLSQALVRVNDAYETHSVGMRGPDCTIDFGGEADDASLRSVEEEVNRAARRALSVMTFEVDDTRLGEYRLRRPAKVSGRVRLVAIGDYDLVACGGTHLRSSAEALPIKIVGLERVKGGLNRLTFRAGEEAVEDHVQKHAVTSALGVLLSAPLEELTVRAEQLRSDNAELRKQLDEVRRARARALAEQLTAHAEGGVVTAYLTGDDAQLFGELVDLLQRAPNVATALAAEEAGDAGSRRGRLAFLAGPGLTADVRPALKTALDALGGRGGGRPDRAQGAAEADEEQARAALKAAAEKLLT